MHTIILIKAGLEFSLQVAKKFITKLFAPTFFQRFFYTVSKIKIKAFISDFLAALLRRIRVFLFAIMYLQFLFVSIFNLLPCFSLDKTLVNPPVVSEQVMQFDNLNIFLQSPFYGRMAHSIFFKLTKYSHAITALLWCLKFHQPCYFFELIVSKLFN